MRDDKVALKRTLTEALLSAIDTVAESMNRGEASFSLTPVNPVRILFAYSGGRDSEAMLQLLAELFHDTHHASIANLTVMHVNHGISKNADAWAEHCRKSAEKLKLPFILEEVYVPKVSADGLEAAARKVRYRALYKAARQIGADVIFTAHHLDDQLETFLIQWVRGSGLEGLSALPMQRDLCDDREGPSVRLVRPWLNISRETIDQFVSASCLSYVEDESNADTRYFRNLIRHEIFPVLTKAREGWKNAAARSISLLAESSQLLKDIALSDTALCRLDDGSLSIPKLRELPASRQALVLRQWLTEGSVRTPSKVKLTDALRQINETRADTRLMIRFEEREMRRTGDRLILRDATKTTKKSNRDFALVWNGEAQLSLGAWGGVLRFDVCGKDEEGFDPALLRAGPLMVRSRKGGEKIKLHPFRPSRHLKHLYQASKIPAFDRDTLPLIWLGEELIFAAGLGAEVRAYADKDFVVERVKLTWVPDQALF